MKGSDLEREGWIRRFTASGERLEEAVLLYRGLGYDVTVLPPEEAGEGCTECFSDAVRTLYTRPREKGGTLSGMRIDLHCHTLHSGDNDLDPRDLVRLARERGLDAVAVTEHDSYAASEAAWRIGREEGFPVFRGIEVATDRGHLLLFGIEGDAPELWRRGGYAPAAKVIAWARARGAAVISAHPYSTRDLHAPRDAVLVMEGLSAIEALNGRCSPEENASAEGAARLLRLPIVGGSDCHRTGEVARCCTVFENPVRTPEDLVRELLAGRCGPERLP